MALHVRWLLNRDHRPSQTLDFQRIYDSMQKPAFIFDGRNILDHAALREIGFEVYVIGRGQPL